MAVSKVPRQELVRLFAARLRSGDPKVGSEIAAYLLNTGRTAELDSLLRDLVKSKAADGTVEVTATTAHSLTQQGSTDVERQVMELLPTTKKVVVINKIDPSILAGVILELPGQRLDLSARAKLNTLKQLTGKDR